MKQPDTSHDRFRVPTQQANEYYVDQFGENVRITFIQSINGIKFYYPAFIVHGSLVHNLIATLQPLAIAPETVN